MHLLALRAHFRVLTSLSSQGPTGPSVLRASGLALAELVLQQRPPQDGAPLRGHRLAAQHPGEEFRVMLVAGAESRLADVEHLEAVLLQEALVAHKHDMTGAVPVNGAVRHNDRVRLLA